MTRPEDEAAWIETGCAMVGIPLDPAWMETIAFNVRVLAASVAFLNTPPIPDMADPAPVFRP